MIDTGQTKREIWIGNTGGGDGLLPIDLVYAQQDAVLSTRAAGDMFFPFFAAQTPPNHGTKFAYFSQNTALSEDNLMFG